MSKHYYGASVVAGIFKGLAIIWMIAGVYAASELSKHGLGANYQIGAISGGVVLGAWCAFFGYVISLLRNIAMNGDRQANSGQRQQWQPPQWNNYGPASDRAHQ